MDLELAQKLDGILLSFPKGKLVIEIKSIDLEDRMKTEAILAILERDGYIRVLGGMGNTKAVKIESEGILFISEGGYTTIAQKELQHFKRNEEERKYQRIISEHLLKQSEEKPRERASIRWWAVVFIILSLAYFLYNYSDTNKTWDSYNTYISIVGGTIGILCSIRRK